jgi:hypothetical protein
VTRETITMMKKTTTLTTLMIMIMMNEWKHFMRLFGHFKLHPPLPKKWSCDIQNWII